MGWNAWIRTVEVEPALYAADFTRLGDQVEVLLRTGARIFHFDVNDAVRADVIRPVVPLIHRNGGVIDCHLLVNEPEEHFAALREAGVDSVTFRSEVCDDCPAAAGVARGHGFDGVGLAFDPETPLADAGTVAAGFDIVSCVAGGELGADTLERVRLLRGLVPLATRIQVDGPIDHANVRAAFDAGADLLVVGEAIFDREDLPRAYRRLVAALA